MITPEQREARRQTIGASDTAAIIGVDPWRTAADVYASKVYDIEDQPTPAMQLGNLMEPVLLDWAAVQMDEPLKRGERFVGPDGILSANLDGRGAIGVVEAKYVGPRGADYWGEPETDQVPEHVALQVQQQMYCADLRLGYIAAAICRPHGLSFEMYYLARDDALLNDLTKVLFAWWQAHVVPRVPPGDSVPNLEILRRIRRVPKSVIFLGAHAAELWAAREAAREGVKAVEAEMDKVTAELLSLLGDNEAGQLPDGRMLAYAPENAGKRLDLERLRLEQPNLVSDYSVTTTRRVLRLKKGPRA